MQAREYFNVERTLASSRSVAVDEEDKEEEEEKEGEYKKIFTQLWFTDGQARTGWKIGGRII